MTTAKDDADFRNRVRRVEALLQEVERLPEAARACTRQIVQTLLEMHSAALDRILTRLADAGPTGLAVIDELGRDDLVGSLLLLYGLHPLDLETRVRQALDGVRPSLRSHGGNVELVGIDDGVVRLRMQGSCNGCPSSARTLESTIEDAVWEKAPDVVAIQLEPAEAPAVEAPAARFSLPLVQ
jgi:Fe-S cluster biogenesis protein NfuA